MKKDDMIMKMGIVHILDSVVGMPVLSDCPIDMGSNLCDFLKAHIEKFTESDDMKVCQFSDEYRYSGGGRCGCRFFCGGRRLFRIFEIKL